MCLQNWKLAEVDHTELNKQRRHEQMLSYWMSVIINCSSFHVPSISFSPAYIFHLIDRFGS